MKIIGNPPRVRQHKHVLTEKAENERQSYTSNIVLGTLAYMLENTSNLPPFCFVCLSFDITCMLCYCNFSKTTKRTWE